MTGEQLKTRQELAQILGVSVTTIRNWDNQNLIPKIKIGNTYRYNVDEVLKVARQN